MTTSEKIEGRSEPFTTAENDAVYQRLVSGDESARNELIEGNMALVIHRVDAYLHRAPQMAYYRDDMISAGIVGLCEVVDRMQKKGPVTSPKPTGWITKGIDCCISRLADESNTIVVPKMTQARARSEGKPIRPPRTVSDKALVYRDDSEISGNAAATELQEEILACCEDDTDRQIVRMRSDGHTDAEIAASLGLSAMTISRRRRVVFERFNKRCPEYLRCEERCREDAND